MKNDYTIIGDEVLIGMSCGEAALIDIEDLPIAQELPGSWRSRRDWNTRYVYGRFYKDGKRVEVILHRLLMQPPRHLYVDHIDHDGLNNKRSNLRVVTNAENQQNRRGLAANNTSGVRGVSWDSEKRKWCAVVRRGRKNVYKKRFDTLEAAAAAIVAARAELMPYSSDARAVLVGAQ